MPLVRVTDATPAHHQASMYSKMSLHVHVTQHQPVNIGMCGDHAGKTAVASPAA